MMKRVSLLALLAVLAGCSTAPSDARIGIDAPDPNQFPPVGEFLGYRCGLLTCHGNTQRNLVIWSCYGLRLPPNTPGCRASGGVDTTPDEFNDTYRSLVGLEPAVMSDVIAGGGADPELLTFVRKARGEENHKGGTLMTPGDCRNLCVTSWLTTNANGTGGMVDTAACAAALLDCPDGGSP